MSVGFQPSICWTHDSLQLLMLEICAYLHLKYIKFMLLHIQLTSFTILQKGRKVFQ